jgi:hypothetical protein
VTPPLSRAAKSEWKKLSVGATAAACFWLSPCNRPRRGRNNENTHHAQRQGNHGDSADNATSRDFVSLLPMSLALEDYGETEKIGYLPRKLSTEGAPPGSDPSAGDVTYYAPRGNLALFRRDFRYSTGLIKLGKIDSGSEALDATGSVKATIERID